MERVVVKVTSKMVHKGRQVRGSHAKGQGRVLQVKNELGKFLEVAV